MLDSEGQIEGNTVVKDNLANGGRKGSRIK